jgi:hypothetical protein
MEPIARADGRQTIRVNPSGITLGTTLLGIAGFLVLALTHFLFLKEAPAFHLDEAWAANFSHRIATEHGFWPIQAMVSYTCPWSHYITAGAFKLFGTNLFVYRATGICEVILGVGLISAALGLIGEKRAALILPFLVAFFPTLVMNHRWVFEENTFFLVCAGSVALGLALRQKNHFLSRALIVTGITAGVSSHVLFLGSSLSLWIYLFLKGKLQDRSDRMTVALIALVLLGFFLLVLKTEPEKAKPLGLLGVDVIILLISLVPALTGPGSVLGGERIRRVTLACLTIAGLPLLIPFFIFGEGTWLDLFFSGKLETPFFIGTIFIPIVLTLYWLRKSKLSGGIQLRSPLVLLPISLLLIQLMVVKPGPRYFEIPYLFAAVCLSMAVSRISGGQRILVLFLWAALGGGALGVNYFKPALEESQLARSYRFWIFHDASFDMLPKLRLMNRLASLGCGFADIEVPDDRIRQTLEFLSLGDWPPISSPCRLKTPVKIVTQASENSATGLDSKGVREGPFLLIGGNVAPSSSR